MATFTQKEPGILETAKTTFYKSAPGIIGRGIQLATLGLVTLIRFIQQLFRDALGK